MGLGCRAPRRPSGMRTQCSRSHLARTAHKLESKEPRHPVYRTSCQSPLAAACYRPVLATCLSRFAQLFTALGTASSWAHAPRRDEAGQSSSPIRLSKGVKQQSLLHPYRASLPSLGSGPGEGTHRTTRLETPDGQDLFIRSAPLLPSGSRRDTNSEARAQHSFTSHPCSSHLAVSLGASN